jgi:branched-chain amino acid:cation transporter, LIVCS family
MSPFLLILLLVLIILGVINAPTAVSQIIQPEMAFITFSDGFMIGYLTMDLFAAFFFSAVIFKQIQDQEKSRESKDIIKIALKPSIIGASLLAFVYLVFAYLGAHYAESTQYVTPELFLPTIATHVMGSQGAFLIGIIVILSCLTTAVALNNIFARYLCTLCNLDMNKFPLMLSATTGVSFCISLLDFRGIAAFLAPLLELSYPSIIVLTIMGIVLKDKYQVFKMVTFYTILGGMLIARLWE